MYSNMIPIEHRTGETNGLDPAFRFSSSAELNSTWTILEGVIKIHVIVVRYIQGEQYITN